MTDAERRLASRRAVLLGTSAVFFAGCTGDPSRPAARPSPAVPTYQPQESAIFDLSLQETKRFRPFELVASGFDVDPTGTPGPDGLYRAGSGPVAPFVALEMRFGAPSGDVSAGLATEDGDHVLVRWSSRSSQLWLSVRREGRSQAVRRRTLPLDGEVGLAFALCENQVTALLDTGDGWRPILTERAKVAALVDLRREDELARYRYAWSGDAEVRAGLFGMTGLRDPHLVQNADGTPYERDERVFLTWTCAGLGFFQQAHMTVWSMDPAVPADMRLEAQLFSRRDGLVLGDHAGQVVRDGNRWWVATSSWGDFEPGSIHVRHTSTVADVLSGVHVLDTEPTELPTEHGSWDPALTRLDGTWHVGFVESPSQDPFDFHPALASTTAREWADDLSLVAAADSLHQCEGPIIATVEDATWLLASDGDDKNYPIFDLTGRRVGRLDAPYPTNIPHPQLLADPAGGWLMVTFDGTQYAEEVMGYGGHGDVVILHSIDT